MTHSTLISLSRRSLQFAALLLAMATASFAGESVVSQGEAHFIGHMVVSAPRETPMIGSLVVTAPRSAVVLVADLGSIAVTAPRASMVADLGAMTVSAPRETLIAQHEQVGRAIAP